MNKFDELPDRSGWIMRMHANDTMSDERFDAMRQ